MFNSYASLPEGMLDLRFFFLRPTCGILWIEISWTFPKCWSKFPKISQRYLVAKHATHRCAMLRYTFGSHHWGSMFLMFLNLDDGVGFSGFSPRLPVKDQCRPGAQQIPVLWMFGTFAHDGSGWCRFFYANLKRVYWWDPWSTIYSSTVRILWVGLWLSIFLGG